MKPVKTTIWDPTLNLDSEEKILLYLEEVFKQDDPELIIAALGDVSRARGMSDIASATGLGRESLYKSLSRDGNPSFKAVIKVLSSLGLSLRLRSRGAR